ncbi:MAG: histidine kinase [Bacteroidota bacterium]
MKQPHQTSIFLQALMRLFFLCVLLILGKELQAQHFYFRNLTTTEGLPGSTVFDMLEDASGYMWFATDKGVVRYDGSNMVSMDNAEGTFARGVFRMFKAKDNSLWFITIDFKLYNYRNRKFTHIELKDDVAWIAEDSRNRVTAISRGGTLYTINEVDRIESVNKFFVSNIARAYMFCSIDSNRFLVGKSDGVFIGNLKTRKIQQILEEDHISSFIIPRVFKTTDQQFFISSHKGLFQLTVGQADSWRIKLVLNERYGEVVSIWKDIPKQDLWIGSYKGLYKLGQHKTIPEKYLQNVNCFNVHKTSEDLLWCTSSESGVFFTNIRSVNINKQEGLLSDRVKFLNNIGDTIYSTSLNGDLGLVYNNTVVNTTRLTKIYDVPVFKNAAKTGDSIYVTAYPDKFIKIYNGKLSEMTVPMGFRTVFGFKEFYYVDNSKIRKGADKRVVHEVNKDSEMSRSQSIPKNVVFHIPLLIINDTAFYYPTKEGYGVVNGQRLTVHHLGARASAILETHRGNFFFSTQGKGIYIKRSRNVSYFLTEHEGLLSNFSSKLVNIGKNVWVVTSKGVSRLTLNNEDSVVRISNYTMDDALNISEVNDLLVHRSSVYVASNTGIAIFPENYTVSKGSPKVIIENIQINSKDTSIRDSFELSYLQNNISITYSSPSIRNAKSALYKYIIVGKESIVNTGISKSKMLQLGALAPDGYLISIWARDIDGLWSAKPAKLFIKILPPFWKTWWFIVVVIGLSLAAIGLFAWIRLAQIQERNKIEARLLDSELKALRLHMNPHFIFNTLNSLQKFILKRNPLEANKYIAKFAKLMRWILSYADKQHITLEAEILFLDTYIELEQLRFDKVFKVVKDIDDELLNSGILIPALVIQPFVENAIKYGITGIDYQGELSLRFVRYSDYLMVTIQDNGVGRNIVKQEQNFSGKEYESTGIKYTNERLLLLLGDKLKIENAVTITDLYGPAGVASGTKVELIIPYYNE